MSEELKPGHLPFRRRRENWTNGRERMEGAEKPSGSESALLKGASSTLEFARSVRAFALCAPARGDLLAALPRRAVAAFPQEGVRRSQRRGDGAPCRVFPSRLEGRRSFLLIAARAISLRELRLNPIQRQSPPRLRVWKPSA